MRKFFTNRLTKQTDFDQRTIASILSEFRSARTNLVDRLYELTIEQAELIAALHFAAEHDDHHLSRMPDLIISCN